MKHKKFRDICKHHGKTYFIYDNSKHKRCLKCRSKAVQKRRDKLKRLAVEYKGGCCQSCGYDTCMAALEFHHKNPNKKDFALSVRGITRAWSKVQNELDKCVLLCANCHREVHANV